jgi:PIN domain nuclease of toxin-antitoxin system
VKILIDTHVFLWWITDTGPLSKRARNIFEEGSNRLFLSVASAWEMAIKWSLGKLTLSEPFEIFLPDQLSQNAIELLPVQLNHVLRVSSLPKIHRDPFDRLLVAQGIAEDLPILTNDTKIKSYAAKTIW